MCIIDATISHATSVIRITHAHPQVEPYPFTSFRLRPPNGAVVGLAHLLLLATTHAHLSSQGSFPSATTVHGIHPTLTRLRPTAAPLPALPRTVEVII